MSKSKKDSPIALELRGFEKKIKQYQDYLDRYDVRTMEDDKKRHDEITCQIKILDSLSHWLTELHRLREIDSDTKEVAPRGGSEISGLMAEKQNK